jgi:amidase
MGEAWRTDGCVDGQAVRHFVPEAPVCSSATSVDVMVERVYRSPMDSFASATQQLAALRRREVTPTELLEAALDRVERHNPHLNAIVWQDVDAARAEAAAIDGPPTDDRPLLGLPVTVKEAFDLAGAPTTWGIPPLAGNVASADAVVVQRLRAAGAVIHGKTNVPMGLADFQTYNDIYGTTNNPWDPSRTPGGSSGGSAVAVATGMAALEMGSDIGGSIRNPAHYCGLFGHKPTWPIIPSRGHALPGVVAEADIGVVGPLARSAADLDLMLDVLAYPDRIQDGIRYDLPPLDGIDGLRVVLWSDEQMAPVSRAVTDRVRGVGTALEGMGAHVVDDARPDFDPAESHRIFFALLQAFMGASGPLPQWEQERHQADAFAPDDPNAALFQARTMSHHTWMGLHHEREQLRWAWRRFFDDHDVVVMPIMPTSAFPHDQGPPEGRTIDVDGEQRNYFEQMFWAGLPGIAHLPGTAVPTGPDEHGLPIGVQIVGAAFADRITIGVARALEQTGFTFQPPPGY